MQKIFNILEVYMNLNNINTTKDWTYYLSMFDASSDPMYLLMSAENLPFKKFNRLRKRTKNKNKSNKMPPLECPVIT